MTPVCFAADAGFRSCVVSCSSAAAVLGAAWASLEPGADLPGPARAAELLVLSSWSPGYEALLDAATGPVAARWHSPLLQTELSREGWKLARILELLDAGRLVALAVNDPAMVGVLGRERVVWLPDVLEAGGHAGVRRTVLEGTNVTLVGEAHGRKNLLVQSAAFAAVARGRDDWTLHLTGQTRRRPGYARWLELAGIPAVDHGVLDRPAYLGLVAGADAGLCASLTESYGYAAADHVLLGIPVVVSAAVASVDGGPAAVADPADVDAVAAALERAVKDDGRIAAAQRSSLSARAAVNADRAREGLATLRRLAATP